ncbi:aromatic-ring-hydroxylating dioxygenase subunit beta [Pseudomonas sp. MWU16-30317]|uniref:aromatic-ring-hydroxylating dioxygenase subunit beta n=1 Tax=Pseudomonas sp. MWU16-30317 TaxID=2878095 RepID=UPI001CFABA5D|nr:aromatic-ring-hydroxylating dioxygenase subunit beta [Pseudomonas sp. MWU16-30317]
MNYCLDDILKDCLDSTYIDNAYYSRLRQDMDEWEGQGKLLDERERQQFEALIVQENWLLDRRQFEQWYQLYSRECLYWVPAANHLPDSARSDAQTNVTIAFDDRRRMGDRIVWLRTGVAYSQLPVSATSHVSTNFVRIPTEVAGETKIRSQFIVHERRPGHDTQVFSGWMGHVFIEQDGVLKIDRKLVCLVDAERAHHNLTFLL